MRETLGFVRNLLRDPRRVAAVAPSGAALAGLITRDIEAHHAPIIELGPGTGVFTSRLIGRGIPEEELVLVESGEEFAERLAIRFPAATVLHLDARQLDRVRLPKEGGAGAVISGLPLLSLPKAAIERILSGAFDHLREDGAFYQFTYGACCPVPSEMLHRLGLEASCVGWVPANLPPASVYRIQRVAVSQSWAPQHLLTATG